MPKIGNVSFEYTNELVWADMEQNSVFPDWVSSIMENQKTLEVPILQTDFQITPGFRRPHQQRSPRKIWKFCKSKNHLYSSSKIPCSLLHSQRPFGTDLNWGARSKNLPGLQAAENALVSVREIFVMEEIKRARDGKRESFFTSSFDIGSDQAVTERQDN